MISEVSIHQSSKGMAEQNNSRHSGRKQKKREREREWLDHGLSPFSSFIPSGPPTDGMVLHTFRTDLSLLP
jgi:hypothetical protein